MEGKYKSKIIENEYFKIHFEPKTNICLITNKKNGICKSINLEKYTKEFKSNEFVGVMSLDKSAKLNKRK